MDVSLTFEPREEWPYYTISPDKEADSQVVEFVKNNQQLLLQKLLHLVFDNK